VGAAMLSLFIIYDWTATSFENVTRLSGSAVSDAIEQKLTFLAYRFAPVVDGIKSITAYHAGDKVWAEYDILFPEKMPLGWAHDIAETLQYCCEGDETRF
jgi:divalent metal cation (Fe/Co/Zn/Cd) transporter